MGHHDHSKATCPTSDTSEPAIQAIVGSLKWHSVSIIVAGATALFSVLIAVFLIFRHACNFSNPTEQKQIIRIISVIPSFAIISFLCVWQDGSPAPYIAPGRDIGEALPMAAFFLLMSTYLAPDESNRDDVFAEMALSDKKGVAQGGGSLSWYRKLTFGVLQWLPISVILWIATAVSLAAGTYCITSNNVHFAHIWITVIRTISTFLAISSILGFYKRFKLVLKPRGAFKQLICFKLIVLLNFLQTLIFSFLHSSGDLHATKYLTSNDISNGLPALILCCEMALISPFFLMAYCIKPYTLDRVSSLGESSLGKGMQQYHGGPLGFYAILQAMNVFNLVVEPFERRQCQGQWEIFAISQSVHPNSASSNFKPRSRYACEESSHRKSFKAARVKEDRLSSCSVVEFSWDVLARLDPGPQIKGILL